MDSGHPALGPASPTSHFCSEDKAGEQVASDQKDREGFMEELTFEFIPEGEGKERSGLGEEMQRLKKKKTDVVLGLSAWRGRSGWVTWGEGGATSLTVVQRYSEGTGNFPPIPSYPFNQYLFNI